MSCLTNCIVDIVVNFISHVDDITLWSLLGNFVKHKHNLLFQLCSAEHRFPTLCEHICRFDIRQTDLPLGYLDYIQDKYVLIVNT